MATSLMHVTFTSLVAVCRHSFCCLNSPDEEDVVRRIPDKLCKKLSKSKLSCPFADLCDSTDVTYSESETDVVDPDEDEELVLRKLDASFTSLRLSEVVGSDVASRFPSLRSLGRGEDISQLTLEVEADDGHVAVLEERTGSGQDHPTPPNVSTTASTRASFRPTPEQ